MSRACFTGQAWQKKLWRSNLRLVAHVFPEKSRCWRFTFMSMRCWGILLLAKLILAVRDSEIQLDGHLDKIETSHEDDTSLNKDQCTMDTVGLACKLGREKVPGTRKMKIVYGVCHYELGKGSCVAKESFLALREAQLDGHLDKTETSHEDDTSLNKDQCTMDTVGLACKLGREKVPGTRKMKIVYGVCHYELGKGSCVAKESFLALNEAQLDGHLDKTETSHEDDTSLNKDQCTMDTVGLACKLGREKVPGTRKMKIVYGVCHYELGKGSCVAKESFLALREAQLDGHLDKTETSHKDDTSLNKDQCTMDTVGLACKLGREKVPGTRKMKIVYGVCHYELGKGSCVAKASWSLWQMCRHSFRSRRLSHVFLCAEMVWLWGTLKPLEAGIVPKKGRPEWGSWFWWVRRSVGLVGLVWWPRLVNGWLTVG